jgi:alkylation response protein AidB-like acyl-CoA dehydrogenase
MATTALLEWLDDHAHGLDVGSVDSRLVLPQLASSDALRVGVSRALGGNGKTLADAVEILAVVAARSMTAALVLWGQRSFIEYMLHSSNDSLRERLLPSLLDGKLAGTIGFSNPAKFLSGVGGLQVRAKPIMGGWLLNGDLHWVTNLRPNGFVVGTAIEDSQSGKPFVVAIPASCTGLRRSEDLQLSGLQSSNTAALNFSQVKIGSDWMLHEDTQIFLRAVRPALLGMQCGLAIGLARRALQEALSLIQDGAQSMLLDSLMNQRQHLEQTALDLKYGLLDGRFRAEPAHLFKIKIALRKSATDAVLLELHAMGPRAHFDEGQSQFPRRWKESSFVPIIIPTTTQLCASLRQLEHYSGESTVDGCC